MEYAIEVKNLVKRYKDFVALSYFNMEVREGEIFGLLGPNGSGKTTTINCILSLLNYDQGEIRVFGKEMKQNSYDIKREIGVVMQNVAVFEEMTVYENIDYFCGLYIKDKAQRKKNMSKMRLHLSNYRIIKKISSKEIIGRSAAEVKYCLRNCTQTKADFLR